MDERKYNEMKDKCEERALRNSNSNISRINRINNYFDKHGYLDAEHYLLLQKVLGDNSRRLSALVKD